jgi:hypothetical protein
MQQAFNYLTCIALGQILPHIWIDGMIALGDLLAFMQLLTVAFGNPYRVTTTEWKIHKMNQINCNVSQGYAGFSVIAGYLDWNVSVHMNVVRMRLLEQSQESI